MHFYMYNIRLLRLRYQLIPNTLRFVCLLCVTVVNMLFLRWLFNDCIVIRQEICFLIRQSLSHGNCLCYLNHRSSNWRQFSLTKNSLNLGDILEELISPDNAKLLFSSFISTIWKIRIASVFGRLL